MGVCGSKEEGADCPQFLANTPSKVCHVTLRVEDAAGAVPQPSKRGGGGGVRTGPGLEDLPQELVVRIANMGSARDAVRLSGTCRRLRFLHADPDVWKHRVMEECWWSGLDPEWNIRDWTRAYHHCPRELFIYHKVEITDTLFGVALRYNVTPTLVKRTNHILNDHVFQQRMFVLIPVAPNDDLAAQKCVIGTYRDKVFDREVFTLTTHGDRTEPRDTVADTHAKRSVLSVCFKHAFGGNTDVAAAYIALHDGDVKAGREAYASDLEWAQKQQPGGP